MSDARHWLEEAFKRMQEKENANLVVRVAGCWCCHVGCEREPDWIIKGPGNPSDDYTEMCDEHHLEYYDPEIDRLVKIIRVEETNPEVPVNHKFKICAECSKKFDVRYSKNLNVCDLCYDTYEI